MAAVKNPEIRKAVNTLYELSANATVRAEYEARRKAERDYINGMEGAYKEGIKKTARNALAQGLPLEVIQKITGLSQEEISKL